MATLIIAFKKLKTKRSSIFLFLRETVARDNSKSFLFVASAIKRKKLFIVIA